MKLRLFDKIVLSLLCVILVVRAPFIAIPFALIIYMVYAIIRSYKEKMKKKKRKRMKKQIKKLEEQKEVPATS